MTFQILQCLVNFFELPFHSSRIMQNGMPKEGFIYMPKEGFIYIYIYISQFKDLLLGFWGFSLFVCEEAIN